MYAHLTLELFNASDRYILKLRVLIEKLFDLYPLSMVWRYDADILCTYPTFSNSFCVRRSMTRTNSLFPIIHQRQTVFADQYSLIGVEERRGPLLLLIFSNHAMENDGKSFRRDFFPIFKTSNQSIVSTGS